MNKSKKIYKYFIMFIVVFNIIGCSVAGCSENNKQDANGNTNPTEYVATLDSHSIPLPDAGNSKTFFNQLGGDRGLLNTAEIDYSWDGSSYGIKRKAGSPETNWAGMWHSLRGLIKDRIGIQCKNIFPFVKSEYQGSITGLRVVVDKVILDPLTAKRSRNIELRLELKDVTGTKCFEKTFYLENNPVSQTLEVSLDLDKKITELVLVVDKIKGDDFISVNEIAFHITTPSLPFSKRAFLFSFSWLMENYDISSNLCQDRTNFELKKMENISASCKAAKIAYLAYWLGFIEYQTAKSIITGVADKVLKTIPKGPQAINKILPHFTKNGGTAILENTEWSTVDTAISLLDLILALQLLGDPSGQLIPMENLAMAIDWDILMKDDAISHGYGYNGDLLAYTWKSFGVETLSVLWLSSSCKEELLYNMQGNQSDNGSGFILQSSFPIKIFVKDKWGNDWKALRNEEFVKQKNYYYGKNEHLFSNGLFGLSAAENPEGTEYHAYGIGGQFTGPDDGDCEVFTFHYSGLSAIESTDDSERIWNYLINHSILSPLSNMESMRINKVNGKIESVNFLKGSWNIALQTEGFAYSISGIKEILEKGVQSNNFLYKGYTKIMGIAR